LHLIIEEGTEILSSSYNVRRLGRLPNELLNEPIVATDPEFAINKPENTNNRGSKSLINNTILNEKIKNGRVSRIFVISTV
jgi:hypothetical protein